MRRAALALATAIAVTGPAGAQDAMQQSLKQNCTNDYLKFCAMYSPDSPQVGQCFERRMKDISPNCKAAISAYTKENKEVRRPSN